MHYEQDTASRTGYHLAIETDGDRFICPFPACGQSFRSKDACFSHLPVHEQRMRLSAPTALPDSHMNYYWPRGVPWMSAPKFVEKVTPPGNLPCTVDGCSESFPTKDRLEAHLRVAHKKTGASALASGYFTMDGAAVNVPPFEPPPGAPVMWCPNHFLAVGSCPLCVELEASKGPKPPYKFFEGITIDMALKTGDAKPAIPAAPVAGSSSFSPSRRSGSSATRRCSGSGVESSTQLFSSGSQ